MLMMVLLTVLATMVSSMTWRVLFGFPSFLFLHTVTPLLSLGLFLFTDRAILRKRAIVWADLPYLIYATSWVIVLLILNLPPEVEARRDVSPYFFLSIHNQPWYISLAWFVGLLLTQTALAAILLLLKNRPWSTKKRLQNNQNA